MAADEWQDGVLYDEHGRFSVATIRYCLCTRTGADGFKQLLGPFALREEYSPLHTGMARLQAAAGPVYLVRIRQVSRPEAIGELEVIQLLAGLTAAGEGEG